MATLIERILRLKIFDLTEGRVLVPGGANVTLIWQKQGQDLLRIQLISHCNPDPNYMDLRYLFNGQMGEYRVYFDSVLSNLGKGKIWYFICPKTSKRCRQLYFVNGYFVHREAFSNVFYTSQVRSKNKRKFDKFFAPYYEYGKIKQTLKKRYFKQFYCGQETNRYKRLTLRLRQIDEHLT
ncbi:MAG: hypothetical protein RIM99_14515 [Cyclobacteriaceae bacterium]